MKYLLFLIPFFCLLSCNPAKEEDQKTKQETVVNNVELELIYKNDQLERSGEIDWKVLMEADELRRQRVTELLDSGLVKTSKDYHHAAMVFQHGGDSVAYKLAMKLMQKSIELDSTANKWLLAAATDRYLLSIGKPQIYGTQYRQYGDEPFVRAEIDTTQITDSVRKEFGVETLAEQLEKVKRINKEGH